MSFPRPPNNTLPSQLRRTIQDPTNSKNYQYNPEEVRKAEPEDANAPILSEEVVQGPTQRLYLAAFWIALGIWRILDFYSLSPTDGGSVTLFLKWVVFDTVFLFSVPLLRIPWINYSSTTMLLILFAHVGVNTMFISNKGIPFFGWITALLKVFYGRELGLSDQRVNPQHILYNSSVILGRQIVNILPEGSAILNPKGSSFCFETPKSVVELPIEMNQTVPIEFELLRFDFDNADVEQIHVSPKETKRLLKEARKRKRGARPEDPITLHYRIRNPGVYRLRRVVDESKLEVRPKRSDTYVVPCPEAHIKHAGGQHCVSDVSNLNINLIGTPPFKIKYRRVVNGISTDTTLDGIRPENFTSILSSPVGVQEGLTTQKPHVLFESARTMSVNIPINETLQTNGKWTYMVEEIQDGLRNVINYVNVTDEYDYVVTKPSPIQHTIQVRNRPRAYLDKCNAQDPIVVAKGRNVKLPVVLGASDFEDSPLTLKYVFTPEADVQPNGEHSPTSSIVYTGIFADHTKHVKIKEPGLYSLSSVSSPFCQGEVVEPASCHLQNSPLPDLFYTTEPIFDTYAGRSVGLRVHLRAVGAPPFTVHYKEVRHGSPSPILRSFLVPRNDHQGAIDLVPREAGTYSYYFTSITDNFYPDYSIENKKIVLNQTVEPIASAYFDKTKTAPQVCLDQPVELPVELGGKGPWDLEYDIYYGSSVYQSGAEKNIEDPHFVINTGPLQKGGEYSVALTKVTDRRKTPSHPDDSIKINVRMAKPKVSFKQLYGEWDAKVLDGNTIKLPLSLSGSAPFSLTYRNVDDIESGVQMATLHSVNDALTVSKAGTYQLVDFQDASCPGVIDTKSSKFVVSVVPRPTLRIDEAEFSGVVEDRQVKKEICEGDEDFLKLLFSGHQPFSVQYESRHLSQSYSRPARRSLEHIMEVASVRMESAKAGEHEYKFYNLADHNYPDPQPGYPLIVKQTVHSRPTAQFVNPGRTYRYCASKEADDQAIPITLSGVAPFSLEIEIRHSSYSKPERLTFRNIETPNYELRLPTGPLRLGNSNVIIRSVGDGRGCQSKSENSRLPSSKVQVSVNEAPSITALESQVHYCLGERLSFGLAGKAPFTIYMEIDGKKMTRQTNEMTFSRVADLTGPFHITGIEDSVSMCKASTSIHKAIHPIPVVRVSEGQVSYVDIHEGSETELVFDFEGTPPFEFTYVRTSVPVKGRKPQILDTHTVVTHEKRLQIKARDEGAYEVISIKDQYCSYSKTSLGRK